MKRAYYSNPIQKFITESNDEILGQLTAAHDFNLEEAQKYAWMEELRILKRALSNFKSGDIFLEFAIPRMGKRVDAIFVNNGIIFVLEFKVGSHGYDRHAKDQAIDYVLDLQNFHEGSHDKLIIPILVATEAEEVLPNNYKASADLKCFCANKNNLTIILEQLSQNNRQAEFPVEEWQNSAYKPTPTIVEAAKALYANHSVKDISRSDAGAINLSRTTEIIKKIIHNSKDNKRKSICFISGVPGSGKTLAGLNIATESMNCEKDEYATFLSGNGPLVYVLREALIRDEMERNSNTRSESRLKIEPFIQNIHHFRDTYLKDHSIPTERVVIFDEAQRAWDKEQASKFMNKKHGGEDFHYSEPEFLIKVMDRHTDWCVIICLIGGGQEINTGEAGLGEWFNAIKNFFPNWDVYYSSQIASKEYIGDFDIHKHLSNKVVEEKDLHLGVSVRSFRSEKLSDFIQQVIDNNHTRAAEIYASIQNVYPIYITRDLSKAKEWIKNKARGSERYGLVASSNAIRLRPEGINVKADIDTPLWFLNGKDDIRSSYYLEEVATEFHIQGLELDWVIFALDANLRLQGGKWQYFNFSGTSWKNINSEERKKYLLNSYRVLLTRARQGMVVYVPLGEATDPTRSPELYQPIYEYFLSCGLKVL